MQKVISVIKKHKFIALLVIIVFVIGWYVIANTMPRPLSSEFDYLGKKDFGNLIMGDSKPYSVYYYGTDMTIEEMKEYFQATTVNKIASGSNVKTIDFSNGSESFSIDYYGDKSLLSFMTARKTVISIDQSYYQSAKAMLPR